MSIITLKNEFNEDILACRACLATDTKLYSIHQQEILNAYKILVGCEVSLYDTLPQYLCNFCTILLQKYSKFRENCLKAIEYLEDIRMKDKNITTAHLNNFKQHIQYTHSVTKQLNITHDETTEHISNYIKTNDNDDHFDDQSSSSPQLEDIQCWTKASPKDIHEGQPQYPNELKIYTDTLQIKTELKSTNAKSKTKSKNRNAKSKYFENDLKLREFEKEFDVDIIILSREQQLKDVFERKCGSNYLLSPYKCELCFKGYMSSDILEKHVIFQHDPSRAIVCEYCKFRYKDVRGLNQHLKSHRLKFLCKQCPYVSRTTFNAKQHYKMHGGQVHECRHCGKSYEKLSSHLSHLRLQHPSEFMWCDICGDAFIGTFGLNAHKKRAHRLFPLPYACESCDVHFVDMKALNRHLSFNRCTDKTCVHCGEVFSKALDLKDHLVEVHRSFKEFRCEKCDKIFSRESLYSAHYRRVHIELKDKERKIEKQWICEICGKTLPNKCMLLYHQRNHTGEKPYHCTQCPKKFTMRKLLQSHLRVHTSDRPYICKLCPKTFKGLSALRAHENVHCAGQAKGLKNNMFQ